MIDEFKKQEEYTDVFYGEYCIIDTINKSHPDNGKIYRRGYSEPEYIGQVVGPSGLFCDNIRIITRNQSENKYYDESGNEIIDLTIHDSSNNSSNWGSLNNIEKLFFNLYNFKDLDAQYKQQYKIIVYDIYENISDGKGDYNKEKIATCFAGVYDVLESMQEYPNGQTVLRYSSSPDKILSETIVDSEGNEISVPIIKSWLENISFNSDTGQLVFTGNGCNETLNKVFFLKLLKNVKLDPDGTIHFLYTNDGEQGQPGNKVEVDKPLDKALTWIKDVRLNTDKGQLQIYFNNDKISPVIAENLAIFDNYHGYRTVTNPSYYFEEIRLEDDGFYVKMKNITKDDLKSGSLTGYETNPKTTIENILGNDILYPALTTTEKTNEYLYEPRYTKNPLEIEIKKPSDKKVYGEDFFIKEGVEAGSLSNSKNNPGSLEWEKSEEDLNVYYYDSTDEVKITKIVDPLPNTSENLKAQIFFNRSPLYEIDWPLTKDGRFIEIIENGVTYRKISFEKVANDKTGSLTFGEEDGSFSYKFIGQEGVSGQFNFVKKVEENDLGYTTITNTRNQTSFSRTQNFRIPKEFFFYDGNDYSDYSFHLFANYSYPNLLLKELNLVPLSEKEENNPIEVGTYYISANREEIYEGVSGESGNIYQRVTSSDKIFYYQETCYQIGENGVVGRYSIKKGYPFDIRKEPDKEEEFWNQLQVEQGYWEDLGKISDGLTSDLPSLLANIAYKIEDPKITSEETKNKILWR